MANIQSVNPVNFAIVMAACAWCVAPVNGTAVAQQQIFPESSYTSVPPCGLSNVHLVTDVNAVRWVKFQSLVRQWRDARGARSSIAEMALLPAYQKIIGMGEDAIPLILNELKSEGNAPDHWFWALAAIARDNPVPPASRGKLEEMAKAWLEWGHEEGYV